MINNYRELLVWQKSMDLCEKVYLLTAKLPKEELYALTNQIRRCAISVPSNIAEGHDRKSSKEYLHFLSISSGSLAELETQLILAVKLNYLDANDVEEVLTSCSEVGKMLNRTITTLTNKNN